MRPEAVSGIGPSPAERLLWDITAPDGADRKFRRSLLNGLPLKFQVPTAHEYLEILQRDGKREANRWLSDQVGHLSPTVYRLASDEDALRQAGKRRASDFRLAAVHHTPKLAYRLFCRSIMAMGANPPTPGRAMTFSGAISRLSDEIWWRRILRRTCSREVEKFAVETGHVHRRAGTYASDEAVGLRRAQKMRTKALLEAITAMNELGQEYTLQELADLSVSSPRIRRSELMARIVGFETIAQKQGHEAVFITITCPSRMHARHIDGKKNRAYDGTTPREASRYLSRQWAKIRSAYHRRQIRPYGFRIAEPHHDGTPHWHLLLFVESEQVSTLCDLVRRYALEFDGEEPGAEEHRFKFLKIDPARGSATGYVIKYVSKNIDGHGLEHDSNGMDPAKGAERIEAWASIWGIRQFQQIGGPPVTVYRELRRIGSSAASAVIETAHKAADAGDWASYVTAMDGPQADRKHWPIRLAKKYNDKPGRYGDPLGLQVYGVEFNNLIIPTRLHEWRLHKRTPGTSVKEAGVGTSVTLNMPRETPRITGTPCYNRDNHLSIGDKLYRDDGTDSQKIASN